MKIRESDADRYRAEIDGLRGIAVSLVILYHAGFSSVSGGFIGVDVFFVISGYLITSLIAQELAAGKFKIGAFFERRARRILPALYLVVVCSIPVAWFLLPPGQLRWFAQSLVAVGTSLANVYFWLKTGYFGHNVEELPFIHTWSLSIEEQFYLVFPFLLLLLFKRRDHGISTIIALTALSLITCLVLERVNPEFGFFFVLARAWELLVGSAIALRRGGEDGSIDGKSFSRNLLTILGLAMILVPAVTYSRHTPYPGQYTLLPVIGSALVLMFGTRDIALGRILGSRILVGIGLISYGAYLWHQPLFAFARAVTYGPPSEWIFLGLIVLTTIISYASWRFIEMPIRQQRMMPTRSFVTGAVVLSLLIIGAGAVGHTYHGFPGRFASFESVQSRTMIPSPARDKCHTDGQDYLRPAYACRYFGQTATWAVLGDSHGVELSYALGELLKDRNESVIHLTFSGCQPALSFESGAPGCTRWLGEAVRMLHGDKQIRNVIIAYRHAFYLYGSQLRSFPDVKADRPNFLPSLSAEKAREEYWRSFGELVRTLSVDRNVYILEPVPELGSHIERLVYKRAINPEAKGADEIGSSLGFYKRRNQDVLIELGKYSTLGNVKTIIPSDALCDDKACYAILGSKSMYFDDNHLSVEGARVVLRKGLAFEGRL